MRLILHHFLFYHFKGGSEVPKRVRSVTVAVGVVVWVHKIPAIGGFFLSVVLQSFKPIRYPALRVGIESALGYKFASFVYIFQFVLCFWHNIHVVTPIFHLGGQRPVSILKTSVSGIVREFNKAETVPFCREFFQKPRHFALSYLQIRKNTGFILHKLRTPTRRKV